MCALVLALRKIPIYAPGGGGPVLGSSDSPSYSVAVSDDDAAASRAAFDKAKDALRMIPITSKSETTEFSSDTTANQSVASTIRNRSPTITTTPVPAAEKAALTALNMRQPASDPAHDWETNSNDSSPTDAAARRRSNDIEGVRDMLRRTSTRGKRKGGNTTAATMKQPGVPTIAEPSNDSYGIGASYQDYASNYAPPPVSSIQQISNSASGQGRPGLSLQYPQQAASPPQSSLPETPTGQNAYQQQAKRPLLGTHNSFAQERAEKNNPFFQDGARSPRSPIE